MNVLESKDLTVYKRLLRALGEYSDSFPATGVSKMFRSVLENGLKVLPKDADALSILSFVLSGKSVPAIVHALLNTRFSDLPVEIKPLYKVGNATVVAYWCKGKVVSDKVLDLVEFEAKEKGYWSDEKGKEVKLLGKGGKDVKSA